MKYALIVGFVLGLTITLSSLFAQPVEVTIYDIQYTTDPGGDSPLVGDSVITYGIVTGIFGRNFFIEENPGGAWHGIYVYRASTSTPVVTIGDSIRVTGVVQEYNNATEIKATDPSAVVILQSGVPLPDTTLITVADLRDQESYEGALVRLNSVHFVESGTFSSTLYHIVSSDGLDTALVYIKSQTDIPGNPIPTGDIDIVGNATQYYSHELYPRMYNDFITQGNLPPVVSYVFRSPYTPPPSTPVFVEARAYDVDGTISTIVLYYSKDNGSTWNTSSADSSSSADSLYFFSIPGDQSGTDVLYYVYAVDDQGESVVSDTGSLIFADVPPIKINEVLYDAAGQTEPYAEWVEIYNAGDQPVDLSDWVFADDPDPTNPSGSFDGYFVFPQGTTLGAHEFLILAYDADTFNYYWPDHGSAQVLEYGSVPTSDSLYLGNSGSDIHLFNQNLIPVDVMWYGSGGDLFYMGHSALDVFAGRSLIRVPDGADTDDPQNDFFDSDTTEPGPTPGKSNQPQQFLCADVNCSGTIGFDDINYLASYLYFNGPDPCSMWAADVNCNGVVGFDDLNYIGAYLYFQGPVPQCCPR